MSVLYSFANIKHQTLEDEAGWALWKEVGSRGLDTWVELPAKCIEPDDSGGEPGGSYDYSTSVGDYLATLVREERPEGFYAWLRYALGCLRTREEDQMRRALLCGCGRHLEAWDEEELFAEILTHLGREHPSMEQQEEAQVRELVAAHSYRYECVEEVYTGRAEPDEEFGLDPY